MVIVISFSLLFFGVIKTFLLPTWLLNAVNSDILLNLDIGVISPPPKKWLQSTVYGDEGQGNPKRIFGFLWPNKIFGSFPSSIPTLPLSGVPSFFLSSNFIEYLLWYYAICWEYNQNHIIISLEFIFSFYSSAMRCPEMLYDLKRVVITDHKIIHLQIQNIFWTNSLLGLSVIHKHQRTIFI